MESPKRTINLPCIVYVHFDFKKVAKRKRAVMNGVSGIAMLTHYDQWYPRHPNPETLGHAV